jgi:hypothetical protein
LIKKKVIQIEFDFIQVEKGHQLIEKVVGDVYFFRH